VEGAQTVAPYQAHLENYQRLKDLDRQIERTTTQLDDQMRKLEEALDSEARRGGSRVELGLLPLQRTTNYRRRGSAPVPTPVEPFPPKRGGTPYAQLVSPLRKQATLQDLYVDGEYRVVSETVTRPASPSESSSRYLRGYVSDLVSSNRYLSVSDFEYLDDKDDIDDWAKILTRRRKRFRRNVIGVEAAVFLVFVMSMLLFPSIYLLPLMFVPAVIEFWFYQSTKEW
jgi:hypothetical protein